VLILLTLAAIAIAGEASRPVPLDLISLDRARSLHGRAVVATFIVTKPNHYSHGRTIVGAADHPDGTERLAVLGDMRVDVEQGRRVVVAGTLRVTDWPASFIDGRLVPGWVEVRVAEPK
jgi:hypothetical protein